MPIFCWNDWNVGHIAEHGVSPDEAEVVVRGARPPFPRDRGDGKFLVWGQAAREPMTMKASGKNGGGGGKRAGKLARTRVAAASRAAGASVGAVDLDYNDTRPLTPE